jgi:hypothetical protein
MSITTFKPHQPETYINARITVKECNVIAELRKCQFGRISIYKADNMIIRIETVKSKKIEENLDNIKELII